MDVATLNSIIDTVFPQVSTSLELKELLGLAASAPEYKTFALLSIIVTPSVVSFPNSVATNLAIA
mgnify:CR=1 FL=1